jgi:hypothetical protein
MGMELKNVVVTIEGYFFYVVVLVMPIFATISVANRLRIKNVRLSVRHGMLAGYPLFPTIYAAVQLACIAVAYAIGDGESILKFLFYLLASAFWFVGAAAAEQRPVTNEGIVLSVNSRKNALLKWGSITDYFHKVKQHYTEYHFFYNTAKTQPNGKKTLIRNVAVVRVQNDQKDAFDAILKTELEPRFEVDPVKIFRGEFKP